MQTRVLSARDRPQVIRTHTQRRLALMVKIVPSRNHAAASLIHPPMRHLARESAIPIGVHAALPDPAAVLSHRPHCPPILMTPREPPQLAATRPPRNDLATAAPARPKCLPDRASPANRALRASPPQRHTLHPTLCRARERRQPRLPATPTRAEQPRSNPNIPARSRTHPPSPNRAADGEGDANGLTPRTTTGAGSPKPSRPSRSTTARRTQAARDTSPRTTSTRATSSPGNRNSNRASFIPGNVRTHPDKNHRTTSVQHRTNNQTREKAESYSHGTPKPQEGVPGGLDAHDGVQRPRLDAHLPRSHYPYLPQRQSTKPTTRGIARHLRPTPRQYPRSAGQRGQHAPGPEDRPIPAPLS